MESLNTLQSVDQQNNNDSILVERENVKGTPFTLYKHEQNWFVLLGKYRLSKEFETKEEALEDASRNDWERTMQVVGVMIENYNETLKTL
jgi:hypothetical protein